VGLDFIPLPRHGESGSEIKEEKGEMLLNSTSTSLSLSLSLPLREYSNQFVLENGMKVK
jgi:hypothetical protein